MQNRSSKFANTKLVSQLSFKNTIKEQQPNGLYFFCNAVILYYNIFSLPRASVPVSFKAPTMLPI